jgi:hypothetical protein
LFILVFVLAELQDQLHLMQAQDLQAVIDHMMMAAFDNYILRNLCFFQRDRKKYERGLTPDQIVRLKLRSINPDKTFL